MVRIVLSDDEDEVSNELVSWLELMDPRLNNLEMFHLPRDFPFDFCAHSLTLLEELAVQRLDGVSVLDPVKTFLDDVVGYVGEALLRVAGGRWTWRDGPVVQFDPALDLPQLSPLSLLTAAVHTRQGNVFAQAYEAATDAVNRRQAEDPQWEPTKVLTPGVDRIPIPESDFLHDWHRKQETAFAGFTVAHRVHGAWDFSPDSVDALEAVLLEKVPGPEPATDEQRALVEVAAWYLGETMIRNSAGTWHHVRGAPDPTNPYVGRPFVESAATDAVPILAVQSFLQRRTPGRLRERITHYISESAPTF
jgi:hypothetical protein